MEIRWIFPFRRGLLLHFRSTFYFWKTPYVIQVINIFFREENSVFQSSLALCHSLEFLCDIKNKSIPRDWKVWKVLATHPEGKVWWGENQSLSHFCSHLPCEFQRILKHMEFLQQYFSTHARCYSAHYNMEVTHFHEWEQLCRYQDGFRFWSITWKTDIFLSENECTMRVLGKELCTRFVCERERGR